LTIAAAAHTPHDLTSLSAWLADANRERAPVSPRGGGTKPVWSTAAAPAVATLFTTGLPPVVDHCAGDLTATVSAGMTLAAVNAVLRRAGQWLPLDPPNADRATIGGIVAANDSGPRRHKHGAVRDLIIGVEMVRADGTVAHAGGKVVKNVAGYDLARMMCGSCGSLAVLTAATFKLAPLPPESRTVVATAETTRELTGTALAIAASPAAPTALEIEARARRLYVRFETTEQAAEAQAAAVAALCRERGAEAAIHAGEDERRLWIAYQQGIWSDAPDGMLVKVSVLPSAVGEVIERTPATAVGGRAALGVLYVRWNGASDDAAAWLGELRTLVARCNGSAVVVHAPESWIGAIDPWGAAAGSSAMMRAVKARFDPNGILNPGRGPWGI
jgi:glycolate oxidase FAD binding subunit